MQKKKWLCNNYCRITVEIEIFERYKKFLENLKTRNLRNCKIFLTNLFPNHSLDKLGHH